MKDQDAAENQLANGVERLLKDLDFSEAFLLVYIDSQDKLLSLHNLTDDEYETFVAALNRSDGSHERILPSTQ